MKKSLLLALTVICLLMFCNVALADTLLHDEASGTIITFSGKQWMILEQKADGATYIILNSNDGDRMFDPDCIGLFDPSDSNNIGYYLNNTFCGSLSQNDLIESYSWEMKCEEGTISQVNVTCKVALISFIEYNTYRSLFPPGGDGYNWWTRSPRSSLTHLVWWVSANGVLGHCDNANYTRGVRPALYLKSGLMIDNNKVVVGEDNSNVDAPSNLTAIAGNAQVSLSWDAVIGATGYNVKRSTTTGGPYTIISSSVSGNTYTDTTAINGTTYYYVVSALNAEGEGENSNEVSATPQASASGDRALLVVTMANGADQNYDLSMEEINAFINWYNSKATGVGQPYYCINATPLSPYTSRTDYLIFDKIVCFKVNQ